MSGNKFEKFERKMKRTVDIRWEKEKGTKRNFEHIKYKILELYKKGCRGSSWMCLRSVTSERLSSAESFCDIHCITHYERTVFATMFRPTLSIMARLMVLVITAMAGVSVRRSAVHGFHIRFAVHKRASPNIFAPQSLFLSRA